MLTDAQCRNAVCPLDKKQARFADSGGLYLQVDANGSKRWFWKYRIAGVEKRLSLGSYPDVNLKLARQARDDAKSQKTAGYDPLQARKVAKLKESALGADSFQETALEWFEKHKTRWSDHYAIREKRTLEPLAKLKNPKYCGATYDFGSRFF